MFFVFKQKTADEWRISDWSSDVCSSDLRTQHYPRPRPMDRALIAAHGKALTMLATTLQARGVLDVEDFAGTLGVFSVVVGEDNRLEGDILAVWAGIMKDSL